VAEQDVEVLRKARESFVRKRRAMAEQMVPAGAASASVVHGSGVGPHCPLPRQGQATRTYFGRPSSSIRLST
jgi:hypothetical protein